MGVRLHNPTTGRFLSIEPVTGGNADADDYVHADPLKKFDLDGKNCRNTRKNGRRFCIQDNRGQASFGSLALNSVRGVFLWGGRGGLSAWPLEAALVAWLPERWAEASAAAPEQSRWAARLPHSAWRLGGFTDYSAYPRHGGSGMKIFIHLRKRVDQILPEKWQYIIGSVGNASLYAIFGASQGDSVGAVMLQAAAGLLCGPVLVAIIHTLGNKGEVER